MFTKRLKELRKARGLSQGALAKELGLSQQAVGKWETGRSTPDLPRWRRWRPFSR